MASFVDNVSNSYNFNPYIQQLPADEIFKVGMEKQQMFDQGVQKVQGYIDNIAGMPIARGVGKEYLNQKIGQLHSAISNSISQDFSDVRLQNQIGGYAKQIGNDPVIQSEVQGTLQMQAEDAKLKKDDSEGKLTPDNEYDYTNGRNSWLNNTNLNTPFNATYHQHYNVDKDIMDAVDKVGEDGITSEQIFITDGQGHLRTDANGTPVFSPYATKLVQTGKMPQKIYSAIQIALSKPEVQQQLGITGRYEYRGYDNKQMAEEYMNTHNQVLTQTNNQILELGLELAKATGDDKTAIQKQIDLLQSDKTQQENDLAPTYNEILGAKDLSPYKGSVYTSKLVNNYVGAFSTLKQAQTYETNPGWQADMDLQKFQWLQKNDIRTQDREDLKWLYSKDNPNRRLQLADIQPLSPTRDRGQFSFSAQRDETVNALNSQYKTAKQDAVIQYLVDLNGQNGTLGNNPNKSAIDAINSWAQQNKETPQAFIDRMYDKIKAASGTNAFSFYNTKSAIDVVENIGTELSLLNAANKQVNDILPGALGKDFVDISTLKIPNSFTFTDVKIDGWLANRDIHLPAGTTLSREDMFNVALLTSSNSLGIRQSDELGNKKDVAEQQLKQKFGDDNYKTLINIAKGYIIKGNLTAAEFKHQIDNIAAQMVNKNVEKTLQKRNELIQKQGLELPNEGFNLLKLAGIEKAEDKENFLNGIGNLAAAHVNESPNFDRAAISASIKAGFAPNFEVNRSINPGQNTYVLSFKDPSSGEFSSTMYINEQDLKGITNLAQLPFPVKPSRFDRFVKVSNYGSTSLNISPNDPKAYYQAYWKTIPNITSKVRANAVKDPTGKGYYMKLYKMDNNGNIQIADYKEKRADYPLYWQSGAEMEQKVNNFTQQDIDYLFNNK